MCLLELERLGIDITTDRLWSARLLIDSPQIIQQIHESYYEGGANICISSSYQASFEGFEDRGLTEEEARILFQQSVTLAQVILFLLSIFYLY